MRYAPRALLAGGLGFAVSLLVACGGSGGLLSTDQASTLNSQLDQLSSALGSHSCGAAASAATDFSNAVSNLAINASLQQNLSHWAAKVSDLTASQCPATTTPTTSIPTTRTNTTTTPTAATTTATTPSNTTPAPPPTTPTATAPGGSGTTTSGSGGAGLGGGSGGGNGNGSGGGSGGTGASSGNPTP
jgi:hypothetical protein